MREWLAAVVVLTAVFAGSVLLACCVSPWFVIPAVVSQVLQLWVLVFFRDPDRPTPTGPGLMISPADGVVSDITNVGESSALGVDGVKIGIFMNVFDVHVNRSPLAAVVESVEHTPGAFLDARDPAASERNESATIRLRHERDGREYPIVVRQIAGLIARRIVTDLTDGQRLERGQRIGMIKFGSRVELLAPRELVGEVCVAPGCRVRAGQSVLISGETEAT